MAKAKKDEPQLTARQQLLKKLEAESKGRASKFYPAVRQQIGPFAAVSWDWKQNNSSQEELLKLLGKFAQVEKDPQFEGSDTYGYLIFHPNFHGEEYITEWEQADEEDEEDE